CINCVTGSQIGSLPGGSGNYLQNTMVQQAGSNFNISGNGTAAGILSGDTVNAATQYNIGGVRVFRDDVGGSAHNTFTEGFAGVSNTPTAVHNSFYGYGAGFANDTGGDNAFF